MKFFNKICHILHNGYKSMYRPCWCPFKLYYKINKLTGLLKELLLRTLSLNLLKFLNGIIHPACLEMFIIIFRDIKART